MTASPELPRPGQCPSRHGLRAHPHTHRQCEATLPRSSPHIPLSQNVLHARIGRLIRPLAGWQCQAVNLTGSQREDGGEVSASAVS